MIYLDIETSGLFPAEDQIIEVAAVVFEDGAEVDAFTSLVWPGETVYGKLVHAAGLGRVINAVPLKDLQTSPAPCEAAGALASFLAGFPGASLHSYNVAFDKSFLAREPWNLADGWGECVMQAAARGGRWLKLGAAIEKFGLAWGGTAHRALDDARMAARLHWEVLQRRQGKTYGTLRAGGGRA